MSRRDQTQARIYPNQTVTSRVQVCSFRSACILSLNHIDPLASSKTTAASVPNVSAAPRSPAGRGRRRQYGTQPTRLEAVDDPLGPLGAPTPPSQVDEPPAPPQKEIVSARRQPTNASTTSIRSMMDSVNLDDDDEEVAISGPRIPPPVQPANSSAQQRQVQPSVSVEQAAKPSFHILVGDPHKVGDLTSSHTEYTVTTKVGPLRLLCFSIVY
jgi:sorting nexin-1/2